MIYVTHDQVEAMTMGDKIVVLNAGAAIWLAGAAGSLPAGLGVARESLVSGQAARVLQELIEFTQSNSKY